MVLSFYLLNRAMLIFDNISNMQVFSALLRSCQPEYTVMVNQALDMLVPVLPQRLFPSDSHVPGWIRCTKIILVEEGHLVPNMIDPKKRLTAKQVLGKSL